MCLMLGSLLCQLCFVEATDLDATLKTLQITLTTDPCTLFQHVEKSKASQLCLARLQLLSYDWKIAVRGRDRDVMMIYRVCSLH